MQELMDLLSVVDKANMPVTVVIIFYALKKMDKVVESISKLNSSIDKLILKDESKEEDLKEARNERKKMREDIDRNRSNVHNLRADVQKDISQLELKLEQYSNSKK